MEALTTVEKACEEKLLAATKAKVSLDCPGVGREAFSFPGYQGGLPWVAYLLRKSAGPTLLQAFPKFLVHPWYWLWSGNQGHG